LLHHLLAVFDRVGALDDPPDDPVQAIDRPEHRALAREAAAEATVLLTNDGLLPLDFSRVPTVALIGPNAERTQIMGGGSASLAPHYRSSVLGAFRERLGNDTELRYERGCEIDRTVPPLSEPALRTATGQPGLVLEFFANRQWSGEPVHHGRAPSTRLLLLGPPDVSVPADAFSVRATGRFTPTESGAYTFTLVQAGRARLLIDGALVLDGFSNPPPRGTEFFGAGSEEVEATAELQAGKVVDLVIEYSNEGTRRNFGAVKIGCRLPSPPDLLERAVEAAAAARLAIVVVGTNDDWESEGHDRTSLALPGRQDELVRRVTAANRNTIVVLNTGAPVTVDWWRQPRALLQGWFGGQEMANALVDVLTGAAEPGGRLPTTYPMRLEDNPSFGNFPGEFGEARYGEGVLMGYRWYEARRIPVRFPFGHGMSYTTFTIGKPVLLTHGLNVGDALTMRVPVYNKGPRRGSEVVQCYVAPPHGSVVRAPKELKAFAKVHLDPDASTTVTLTLDARAFSYWDPAANDWHVDPGRYELHVGRSSAEIAHVATVDVGDAPAST
jgi:beta-glucosidase